MKKLTKVERELIALLLILVAAVSVNAVQPRAPVSITNMSTESPQPAPGYLLNTSGGTITTININATTQNPRWKGFVGNIDGEFALMDSSLNSLFSWDINSVTGELYATRNSSTIGWDNIACASDTLITAEQNSLNITSTNPDSIQNTFSSSTHNGFYVGAVQVTANSCRTISLNVNNAQQASDFQELLLADGSSLIYTSLLENSTYGYNNQYYDFQMIVAENALEGNQPNTPYYFYVELI